MLIHRYAADLLCHIGSSYGGPGGRPSAAQPFDCMVCFVGICLRTCVFLSGSCPSFSGSPCCFSPHRGMWCAVASESFGRPCFIVDIGPLRLPALPRMVADLISGISILQLHIACLLSFHMHPRPCMASECNCAFGHAELHPCLCVGPATVVVPQILPKTHGVEMWFSQIPF